MTKKKTPKIKNLNNLPITTRKINIREAMLTIVTTDDNIEVITKEIYNHAAKKLGTKSLIAEYFSLKKSTASGQSSTLLLERADLSSRENTEKTHSPPG